MVHFTKIVKGWKPLNILAKSSILEIWQAYEYASASEEIPAQSQQQIKDKKTRSMDADRIIMTSATLFLTPRLGYSSGRANSKMNL